ncbi:MAG TPA: 2-oxo acid dehydrogenase subunit E2, partial [Spirochaetia bacterium]
MKKTGYHVIDFPVTRLSTADVGRFGLKKHYMFGLLEVDVTDARRRLRELRRSGEEVSFTAWMIKTIGDCAARNPLVHAVRWRRRRLVSFDDVDIAIAVDRVVEGQSVPLPLLIRRTNSRSARDIDREIRDALSRPIAGERDFVLGRHSFSRAGLWMYYRLPQALRL